jgi:RimJ/RimL family protein N-acetyltransferase
MLEGDGVRLRTFRPGDIDDVVAGYADPQTQHFMPLIPQPFTRQHAQWYVTEGAAAAFAEGGGAYAITDPATDRLLGGIGITPYQRSRRQGEIGYWVGPHARGRGVATAAVRTLSAHAFAAGTGRLELLTHWENTASQRVALAAGYQPEGVRRGALPNRTGGADDLLAFARVSTDPDGPIDRALPDLPGGELTDGVVTLRPLVAGDESFYTDLHTQPDVVATSVPPVAPSPDEIRRRCRRSAARWLLGERADLVIEDAATGTAAGEIGLFYQEPATAQAMIGYSMLPAWRGRGFPSRAAALVALWAFAETGIARLIAGALPTNVASQRVLEKAGFRREAFLKSRLPGPGGRRSDDVQFVLLAEDVIAGLQAAQAPGTRVPGEPTTDQAVDSSDRMP